MTPTIDRESGLKAAEKALRQGRIEAAITEYVRIVDAHPRDWNSANALGDLYVRLRQVDKGVEQYARIADHLAAEGFYPKAAALYKKILKIQPDEEHALLQSADIAARQGLLADAKTAFRSLAERRKARGDRRGAAEIVVRLGTIDADDLEARLDGARAAAELGDQPTALREFRDVAFRFEKQGDGAAALNALEAAFGLNRDDAEIRRRLLDRYLRAGDLKKARNVARDVAELKQLAAAHEAADEVEEMLGVLAQVAELDPSDVPVRAVLAQTYLANGEVDKARRYIDADTAGRSAPLWLILAEIELRANRLDEGRSAVAVALTLDPAQQRAATALASRLAKESPDGGYACIDAVAESLLAAKDFAGAAAALQAFVSHACEHLVALMRLVEICVDGRLEALMHEAQAQLAEAYLAVGRGLEARIISEDLVAREPWVAANIDRFRRALVLLGEDDPDLIIAERLSGDSPFLATDKMDLNEGGAFAPQSPHIDEGSESSDEDNVVLVEAEELIDLDAALSSWTPGSGLEASGGDADQESAGPVPVEPADDGRHPGGEEAAAEQYGLAVTYRELGMIDDAIEALQTASRSPSVRFDSAALLATLYLERNEIRKAIEWLERATQTPPTTAAAGHAVLYDLAATLEKAGERAKALEAYSALESESPGYRDVAYRILRLSKLQSKR
ncbi:MAG: tetratricopeptide repeat protein [Acidobacteriota bacterium]